MTSAHVDQPLVRLLLEQSCSLATLGPEPLAVASARNKFNDAHEDDYWCSVQLGPYRWEQSQFFGSSEPSGFGYAREHASTRLSRDGYASAEASASEVLAARAILKALDLAGWHELAEKEFRHRSTGGILALVIQFDQVWLHCSDPMGHGDDHLFAVCEDGFVELGFIDQRFDEIVGTAEVICCYEPDPSALPSLSATARAQFDDLIYDRKAAAQLAEEVIPIALTVDDVLHEEGVELPRLALSSMSAGSKNGIGSTSSRTEFTLLAHALPSTVRTSTAITSISYRGALIACRRPQSACKRSKRHISVS